MSAGKVRYKPLYLQVKDVILTRIEQDLYRDGESIPTEAKLAEEFGTSVTTIRQALTLLVNEGILIKKPGRGTYVSKQRTNITFFSWIPETKRGAEILADVIAQFEQKYPTITVECLPTAYNHARKNLMKLISSGNASFSKAMIFCTDAVKKILYEGGDIEKELNEKEYYLNMLYSD